ncbi:MAG: hypothetical protein LIQ31_02715 [Planctomycetes bacterium]|nr:hypothetical protein [Planctomycetota bacterium]
MSMGIGNFTSKYTITSQLTVKKSQSSAQSSGVPTWDPGRVWNSLGDMDKGFRAYRQEWNDYYSQTFAASGANGDGSLTRAELDELLQSEFGAAGVTFIDRKPGDPKAGRHDIYIDDVNRQKMADDPEYRAKMMSVIQMEMAGVTGYTYKNGDRTIQDQHSGTVLSMAEGDTLYEGVPHSGGAVSARGGMAVSTSGSVGASDGKGLMTLIIEKMQEMMEERQLRQQREKQLERQGVQVDISVEARSRRSEFDMTAAPLGETRSDTTKAPESAGLLDVVA